MEETLTITPVKSFVISMKEWLRGQPGDSFLLRDDGQRCCVGIYLKACGVPEERLELVQAAAGVAEVSGIPDWMLEAVSHCGVRSAIGQLYWTNDHGSDDAERKAAITAQFAAKGITVTFVD